jgi:diacylglycerol O-acyltransferase / wax synthase
MPTPHTLSGLDATFLYMETAETPMHIGALHLYELPKGYKGDFHADLKAHIAKRMHLAPVFNRKLVQLPFDMGHPMWTHDDDVDLDYHIRRIILPKPGTLAQLEAYCARLHSALIDRSRPLWEFYVFEGLKSGQMAFYSKIHHAALDGKGSIVMANAVLDQGPVPREVPPPDPSRRTPKVDLKASQLIGAAFSSTLSQFAKFAKAFPGTAVTVGGMVGKALLKDGDGKLKKPGLKVNMAPKTRFNVAITSQRAFATSTIPFASCKEMGKLVGGSFNDVVLYLCATSLRNYLAKHGGLPKKSLVAAMPVSLREQNNQDLNNQASMVLVDLGTEHADNLARMHAIMASTATVRAVVRERLGGCLRQNQAGRKNAGHRQRGDLQRARPATVALYGRGAHVDDQPAVDHRARHCTQHYRGDLRRQC